MFVGAAFEGLEIYPEHVADYGPLDAVVRFGNRGAGAARGVSLAFVTTDDAYAVEAHSLTVARLRPDGYEEPFTDAVDAVGDASGGLLLPDVPAGETLVVHVRLSPAGVVRDGSRIGVQAILAADGEQFGSNVAHVIVRTQAVLAASAVLEPIGENAATATVTVRSVGTAPVEHVQLTQAVPAGCVASDLTRAGDPYFGAPIAIAEELAPGAELAVSYRVTIVQPQMQATIELPPVRVAAANADAVATEPVSALVGVARVSAPVITGLEVPLIGRSPRRVAITLHNDGMIRSGMVSVEMSLAPQLEILEETRAVTVVVAGRASRIERGWTVGALHAGEHAEFTCVVVAVDGAASGGVSVVATVQPLPDLEATERHEVSAEFEVLAAPHYRVRAAVPHHADAGAPIALVIHADNVGDAPGVLTLLVNGVRHELGEIAAGASASIAVNVPFPADIADGEIVRIQIAEEASREVLIDEETVVVGAPRFDRSVTSVSAEGTLRPGEALPLRIAVRNEGSDIARGVTALMRAEPADVVAVAGVITIGDVPAGETREVTTEVQLTQFVERNAPVRIAAVISSAESAAASMVVARHVCSVLIPTSSEAVITGSLTINDRDVVACEAGELLVCVLALRNEGLGHARTVEVHAEPVRGLAIIPGSLRIDGVPSRYVDDLFGEGAEIGPLLPGAETCVSWAMYVDARAVGNDLRPIVRVMAGNAAALNEVAVITSSSIVAATGRAQLVPTRPQGALASLPGPLKALVAPEASAGPPAEPAAPAEAVVAAAAAPPTESLAGDSVAAHVPVAAEVREPSIEPSVVDNDSIHGTLPSVESDMAARMRSLLAERALEDNAHVPVPGDEAVHQEELAPAASEPAASDADERGEEDDEASTRYAPASAVAMQAVVVEMDITAERVERAHQYLRQSAGRGFLSHLFAIRAFFPDRVIARTGTVTLLPESLGFLRDELKAVLDRLLLRLQIRSYGVSARDVDSRPLVDALFAITEALAGSDDASYVPTPRTVFAALDVATFAQRKADVGVTQVGDGLTYYLLAQFLPQRGATDDLTWALIEYRASMLDALAMLDGAGADAFERAVRGEAPLDLDAKLDRVLAAFARSVPVALPA